MTMLMMRNNRESLGRSDPGFTLIEMLLVLVIISVLFVMGMNYTEQRTTALRIDRTVMQMEQILNASLSYYVANGEWPYNLRCLQTIDDEGLGQCNTRYLPGSTTNLIFNPWRALYTTGSPPGLPAVYYAVTSLPRAYAPAVAGRLPMGFTLNAAADPLTIDPATRQGACPAAGSCYIAASVTIPGQNLNNAAAINFAGVYNHGGCVPVPVCPGGSTMLPQIMVAIGSASGFMGDVTGTDPNVYPISSFTAYARGGLGSGTLPPRCDDNFPAGAARRCVDVSGTNATDYWRVCLQLVTEKGSYAFTTNFAKGVTLVAFTRCAITNERSGSTYEVFG
ncbi:MAG TPA: type II secretion system protein [Gammaproteobacteria bacterium]|nr:type II secretion system protein [Gammaproteobacteria bacterium]